MEFVKKITNFREFSNIVKLQFSVRSAGCGQSNTCINFMFVQEMFSKKDRELAKLRQHCVAHVVAAGKLASQQSDWLTNEMTQKQEAVRGIFAAALSQRLAAVTDKKAKRKCLVESEVNTYCSIIRFFDL